jgi:type IV pilus assembly protein PilP
MRQHFRRSIRVRTLAGAGLAVLLNVGAGAQQPSGSPAAAPPAPAARPAEAVPPGAVPPAPAAAAAYTYSPAGRRDPFVSLIGRGTDAASTGSRPAGVPGLLINEVSIKGIIRDRSGLIAMIQGADNRTYVVRAGDRLMDGTVKAIVQDAVVFSQDVNDPLSLVKQKEIRKNLRSAEGGRG